MNPLRSAYFFFVMLIDAHAQPCGASLVCFSDIPLGRVGFLTETRKKIRPETVETITEEVGPERESNLSVMWLWYHTPCAHGACCLEHSAIFHFRSNLMNSKTNSV